ncbi:hypothetical protein L1987_81391 [Smallanthus sonchifolius]|uniref:Uncharacterized protein n=1 Tax=Smallanthus sonchifolius TaxID=185202 RepID=A0ACB8YRL4_9ASTR|nr:hypothetical protein L1987_81391 [Smallanthus sonchifolius]
MTDRWMQSALTNDVLVAEFLLQVKHSSVSDSDSLRAPPPPPPAPSTSISKILPPHWGHRKYRSKSTSTNGGKEHRGSPTTHLSWSGGSNSDESSRPSDLSSGCRSVKVNEKRKVNEQELTSNRVTLNQQRNKTRVTKSCRVEAETEAPERGFVLPDLNMTPSDEDLAVMG